MEFTYNLSKASWYLTNIYGPCQADKRIEFFDWFSNIQMPDNVDWIILGDFNFIRSREDRNKPGGNVNDMLTFNEAINNLGLVELPLKGRKFTWSNMQQDPLLERLDWFFISASWTITYPFTFVSPLSKPTSDHIPNVINIESSIPKERVFRFENFWLQHSDFKDVVQNHGIFPLVCWIVQKNECQANECQKGTKTMGKKSFLPQKSDSSSEPSYPLLGHVRRIQSPHSA